MTALNEKYSICEKKQTSHRIASHRIDSAIKLYIYSLTNISYLIAVMGNVIIISQKDTQDNISHLYYNANIIIQQF